MLAREMTRRLRQPGEAAVAEPATATELDALDEADALVSMPDADFVRMLRSK